MFRIPDIRSRTIISQDTQTNGQYANLIATTNATGTNVRNLAATGGVADQVLALNQIPYHSHTFERQNAAGGVPYSGAGTATPDPSGDKQYLYGARSIDFNRGSGGAAVNNTQPFIVLIAAIYT